MGKKRKFVAYVVTSGRIPGIYKTWDETKAQTDGFPGGIQHGVYSIEDAEKELAEHLAKPHQAPKVPAGLASSISEPQNLYRQKSQGNGNDEPNRKRQRIPIDSPDSDAEESPAAKKIRHDEGEHNDLSASTEDESISLTSEQQAVFDAAMKRHNIFLTGAAGCGKTVTIKKILAGFESRGIKYQVVAPTGLAAMPLSGKTLHSFFGWKPDSMQLPLEKLLELPFKKVRKAVERTQVLIIEEVSMVENQHMERMNRVIQSIMEDSRPFGGKQVFLLGDFYQLPPVKPFQFCIMCGRFMSKPPAYRCQDCQAGNAHAIFYEGDKWAFKASVWKDLNLKNIRLKQLHRQKDPRFQDILNKIRNGQTLTEDEWQDLEREKTTPAGIGAVRLMSLRRQVDALNQRELEAIIAPAKTWEAIDSYQELHGDWNGEWGAPWEMDQPLKNHSFAEKVSLKIGAKVVLLVNLDPKGKLVNGSQGEVIGFEEVYGVEPGLAESSPAIRPDGNKFRSNFEPIVRFANGRIKTIAPVEWGSRCGTNQRPYLASRIQIPLILAWALSSHKSQGMTLNYIEVSSKDLFEPGQLYVGLSRATSLEGLVLSGSSRKQLYSDPEVLSFYEKTEWESSTTIVAADSLSNRVERVAEFLVDVVPGARTGIDDLRGSKVGQ